MARGPSQGDILASFSHSHWPPVKGHLVLTYCLSQHCAVLETVHFLSEDSSVPLFSNVMHVLVVPSPSRFLFVVITCRYKGYSKNKR